MKKLIWIIPALIIAVAGCGTPEDKIEKYPDDPAAAKDGVAAGAGAGSAKIPDAAKGAMGGK